MTWSRPGTASGQTRRAERPEAPAPLGRGGRQHKYLQHLVKQLAEERGFRAVIEEPILDGAGKIDVALVRGEERIACEISVSTSRDQELGNVEKCLSAGYERVIVLAPNERHLATLSRFIGAHLDDADRDRVAFMLPEALPDMLASAQAPPASETVVRGYRVKVTHQAAAAGETQARRDAIAKVLARSLRQPGTEA